MATYGILPMAGKGSRIQPIGFSKELYPVTANGKHYAVSEFSIRSMLKAHVDEIKLVVNPEKMDIPKYFANYSKLIGVYFYSSTSLPESCLYPIDAMHDDDLCLFGLPDTLFTPNTGYIQLKLALETGSDIVLGVFNVNDASKFDSVDIADNGQVRGVLVKQSPPLSPWIWGIWGANVKTLRKLKKIIMKQDKPGERLLGEGFNQLCKQKGIRFAAVKLGNQYFDIGTMDAVVRINRVLKDFEF